jgi:SAM-dependent methyltransferase
MRRTRASGRERAGDPAAAGVAESWVANAEAWTAAVRGGAIPSRRAGTDAAIVEACAAALPALAGAAVLDLGCGEGWLARALAARGARVAGADGSAPLVERARAADPGVALRGRELRDAASPTPGCSPGRSTSWSSTSRCSATRGAAAGRVRPAPGAPAGAS